MKKVITCLLACIFMLFGTTGAYAVETDLSEVEPEDENLVEVIDQDTNTPEVISTNNVETTESKAEEEKQKDAVALCAAIMLGTIIAVLAIAIILKTKLR